MNKDKTLKRLETVAGQLSPGAGVVVGGSKRDELLVRSGEDVVSSSLFLYSVLEVHVFGSV